MDPRTSHREELHRLAEVALRERGLLVSFEPEVVAEVDALEDVPVEAGDRVDLTRLPWCSIDNDDSKDLDQLSWAEPVDGGAIRVLVAVADVDVRVPAGCAVDRHAGHNTTSVYTPARLFPMLPERLSTDLTSLNPDVDRAAHVAEFVVAADGRLLDETVYGAVVRNAAQLAYPSVGAWLDGLAPLPEAAAAVPRLDELLRLQDVASRALERRRFERGALEFETHEPKVVFEGERVAAFEVREKNPATRLIENFMIAANGVNARFLRSKGFDSIHRAVPTPERWDEIADLAAEHGVPLPAEPDSQALRDFLSRRRKDDPLRFPDLSLAIIKLLGRGEYLVEPAGVEGPGHFGLAVRDYTHSTAPNRRYPDLVTQRLLKAALAGAAPPYSRTELDEIASQCTRMEDAAEKAERRLKKSAAALLLRPRIGERFEALVSGASEKGTWVRLLEMPVEGRVVRGGHDLKVGRRVRVKLLRTNVGLGHLDFARA